MTTTDQQEGVGGMFTLKRYQDDGQWHVVNTLTMSDIVTEANGGRPFWQMVLSAARGMKPGQWATVGNWYTLTMGPAVLITRSSDTAEGN